MGAKYNLKAFGYWVEFTPSAFLRINKKTRNGNWYKKHERVAS